MKDANKDLLNYVESIPYGSASIQIERVGHKTVKIITSSEETLRYVNNQEAKEDLMNMVDKLVQTGYSGDAHVKLTMKDGKIQLLGIFNKKETNY